MLIMTEEHVSHQMGYYNDLNEGHVSFTVITKGQTKKTCQSKCAQENEDLIMNSKLAFIQWLLCTNESCHFTKLSHTQTVSSVFSEKFAVCGFFKCVMVYLRGNDG